MVTTDHDVGPEDPVNCLVVIVTTDDGVTRTLLSQAGCHSDHCGDVAPVRMCAGRRLHTVSYGSRVQFGICLSVHGEDRNVLTVLPAVQPSASINGDTDL